MEKWELKPTKEIGKIIFGMDREDVHQLFTEKCTEFKKTKFSKNTTDDYGKFHIYYSTENKVEAVEFFEDVEITINGKRIFPESVKTVESIIGKMESDSGYYTHKEFSIGFFAPENIPESILVGGPGYY